MVIRDLKGDFSAAINSRRHWNFCRKDANEGLATKPAWGGCLITVSSIREICGDSGHSLTGGTARNEGRADSHARKEDAGDS